MSSSPKKYDFSGKVALVTGSSSGIGAAIAIQLAKYGARVVITGRSAEGLEKVAAKIVEVSHGVAPLQVIANLQDDSAPEQLITETLAKFGRLDLLVNNAGGGTPQGNLSSPNLMAEFDIVYKLNVRSVIDLIQRATPHLEKSGGNIVNISTTGSIKPVEGTMVYASSKAALDMVTKTAALELGPKGIRVNSVNPGPVATQIGRSFGQTGDAIGATFQFLAPMMLMKRVGMPEDIANLTVFLLSEDAVNITGSIMVSDSGALLSFPQMKDFVQQ